MTTFTVQIEVDPETREIEIIPTLTMQEWIARNKFWPNTIKLEDQVYYI
jgi:hypothetical protein